MKRLLAFMLAILMVCSTAYTESAVEFIKSKFPGKFDHDYFLEYVLFQKKFTKSEDESYYSEDEKLSNLAMIELASTLCIDQFGTKVPKDQTRLDRLRKQVSGLPRNVAEINPGPNEEPKLAASNHRTYTHKGWKFPYGLSGNPSNIAKPKIRETILRKTVSTVFKFRLKEDSFIAPLWYSITGVTTDEARCDAYCRLFYYIHLLGDCYEDDTYQKANGSNNGQKMPLGRANPAKENVEDVENSDIITEFIWLCNDLFENSPNNQYTYSHLKTELERVERDIRNLYRSIGGVNSPEQYERYHECVCELMQVLIVNMPNLLKNEKDFQEAFKSFLYIPG